MMKTTKIYIALLFVLQICLFNNSASAQMGRAEFTKLFTDANYDMLYDNYPAALQKWLELYAVEPTNSNINYKIGFCYLKSNNEKLKSTSFLEVASKDVSKNYDEFETEEKKAPSLVFYYLAKAYHLEGKMDESIATYEKYRPLIKSNKAEITKDIDRQIQMCNNAKEMMKTPVNFTIEDLGDSVNSKYSDFAPVISAQEDFIIFTSRREGSTGEALTDDGQYFEDIYISYQSDTGWTKAKSLGENINTNGHEATINISTDGHQLFIYKDDAGDGNIYVSELNGETWSVPQKMPEPINSKAAETHAALTADGTKLYFVSDRKGGLGGMDIYRCVKLPNGDWSAAFNLGPVINTEYDEDGVFLHPDGIHMFFSSKGHTSMGGYDIFQTTINEDGTFTPPTNIGYPINTTDDDIFFVVSADGKRAYYSSAHEISTSAKDKSLGEKDIYVINLLDRAMSNITIIKGTVRPGDDKEILFNANIIFHDYATGEEIHINDKINHATGKFLIILPPGKDYRITYDFGKYGTIDDSVSVPRKNPYREIIKDFDLTQPYPFVGSGQKKPLVARDDVYYTFPETPVECDVLTNDVCRKGKINLASVVIKSKPINGGKTDDHKHHTGTFKYTPKKGFHNTDDFTYTFKNEEGTESNVGDVKIHITNIIAFEDKAKTNKDGIVEVKVLKNDKTVVGKIDVTSVEIVTQPHEGTVAVGKDGAVTYKVNSADYKGKDTFFYTIKNDAGEKSHEARVDIEVGAFDGTVTTSTKIVNGITCENAPKEYQKFFTYNQMNIDKKQKDFDAFISGLIDCINKNGTVKLAIESSASKVPTSKYKTNDKLAEQRLEEAKQQILNSLKANNIIKEKVSFVKTDALIQGPEYNKDFIENKATYEKFQYVKISIQ